MAKSNTYKRNYISYEEYVEGSTVRKLNNADNAERQPRTYDGNRRVRTSAAVYKNRERATRMSKGYVAVLAVCCLMMSAVCAQYLSLRDSITTRKAEIATLELQVDALKAQNDSIDYTINSYIDVDHIRSVAMGELGMIQAGKNQISFYQSSESEYMKQYREVPEK